jgi:hypothetical protein
MAKSEIMPQKIVDTKTVILKSKFDSGRIKTQGEKLKTNLFVRFGFVKPKPKDVLLIAFTKYYEPYIVIGGKYSVDYCKRHDYAFKVEDETQALIVGGEKFKTEPLPTRGDARVIKLMGEEHSHYENETYVVLDRMLQEIPAENLFLAPSESELDSQRPDLDLRKPRISLEEEIRILRFRIAKRPADAAEIIREHFEINERSIIYSPVYELTYKNLKNGKKITAKINGVTGDVVIGKFEKASAKLDLRPTPEIFSTAHTQVQTETNQTRQPKVNDDVYVSSATGMRSARNLVEKRVDTAGHDPRQRESCFQSSGEKAKCLADDLNHHLGHKEGQFPAKPTSKEVSGIVEIKLQDEALLMSEFNIKTKKR